MWRSIRGKYREMRARPEHHYRQSGVIPYRRRRGRLELLMVTTTSGKRWIIPKGVKELHLSPRNSAVKEALEEAGVRGKVSRTAIGNYRYRKWGGICTVQVFVMQVSEVLRVWEEDFRERQWFSHREALHRVEEKELQQIIRLLPALV